MTGLINVVVVKPRACLAAVKRGSKIVSTPGLLRRFFAVFLQKFGPTLAVSGQTPAVSCSNSILNLRLPSGSSLSVDIMRGAVRMDRQFVVPRARPPTPSYAAAMHGAQGLGLGGGGSGTPPTSARSSSFGSDYANSRAAARMRLCGLCTIVTFVLSALVWWFYAAAATDVADTASVEQLRIMVRQHTSHARAPSRQHCSMSLNDFSRFFPRSQFAAPTTGQRAAFHAGRLRQDRAHCARAA